MLTIMILDHDLDRMNTCERSVKKALKKLNLKADVTKVNEPPFLARLNIWDRLPALDINNKIWSRQKKEPFTTDEILGLLTAHYLKPTGQN